VTRVAASAAALLISAGPIPASAHHGPPDSAILYDRSQILEYDGIVTDVLWRNPHIRFRMLMTDESGTEVIREMEIGPNPRSMRQAGISEDILHVGAQVRVAGFVSKRDSNSMGIVHLLLPSGEEITHGGRAPRWSEERLALDQTAPVNSAEVAAAVRDADNIFRVWSNVPGFYPRPPVSSYAGYLTERGQRLAEAYDPVTDNPELECRTGMPATMFDPGQMLIEQNGDRIDLRIYEYDIQRTIHMRSDTDAAQLPVSNVGYSVGRWEGDALVVTTAGVNYPYLDASGTPQSDQVRLTERFSMTADGQRLNYSMTADDPIMFTEPVTLERFWRWTPDIPFEPFDCASWSNDAE
jgi:hypothetical protein